MGTIGAPIILSQMTLTITNQWMRSDFQFRQPEIELSVWLGVCLSKNMRNELITCFLLSSHYATEIPISRLIGIACVCENCIQNRNLPLWLSFWPCDKAAKFNFLPNDNDMPIVQNMIMKVAFCQKT